jgi:hypothetical protein
LEDSEKPTAADALAVAAFCAQQPGCRVVHGRQAYLARPGDTYESLLTGDTPPGGDDGAQTVPPDAQMPVGGGVPPFCVLQTGRELFDANRAQLGATLAAQADQVATQVFAVVQKYHYQINLDAARDVIDTDLGGFYGDQAYAGGVSATVDAVLAAVRGKVRDALAASRGAYVDQSRLQARLLALSDLAWDALLGQQQDAFQSAKLYRTRFPPPPSNTRQDLLIMSLCFLTVAGVLALLCFCLLQARAVRTGQAGLHAANWAVALLGCCTSLMLTVLGGTVARRAARAEHNAERRQANTDSLVASLQNASAALQDARQALARDPRALVDPALEALKAAVDAYDACNTISSGVPPLPFPALEVLVYAGVAAALLGGAAYVYGWMDVSRKLGMARDLLRQRALVRSGKPVDDLARILECSGRIEGMTDRASTLVSTYVPAGVLLFINVAFLLAAGRNGDYAAALGTVQGCV